MHPCRPAHFQNRIRSGFRPLLIVQVSFEVPFCLHSPTNFGINNLTCLCNPVPRPLGFDSRYSSVTCHSFNLAHQPSVIGTCLLFPVHGEIFTIFAYKTSVEVYNVYKVLIKSLEETGCCKDGENQEMNTSKQENHKLQVSSFTSAGDTTHRWRVIRSSH